MDALAGPPRKLGNRARSAAEKMHRSPVRPVLESSARFAAVIYLLVTLVGAQSRGQFETAPNGGEAALAQIADYYFGGAGMLILAVPGDGGLSENQRLTDDQLQPDLCARFLAGSSMPDLGSLAMFACPF